MFEQTIAMLFEARNVAHELHLKTKVFSQHIALGELYEGLTKLSDDLAEVIMGNLEQFNNEIKVENTFTKLPIPFVTELKDRLVVTRSYIQEYRKMTDAENIIDELLALVNKTSYKLKAFA